MFDKISDKRQRWLLFFYSIPSRPVSSRMKIWRRLSKAGAIPLKGAVYILPLNEEHYEFFQWLVSEVSSLGGEAAFTGVERIETMNDTEIVDLFVSRVEDEYRLLKKELEKVEMKVSSVRKGSRPLATKGLSGQVGRVLKGFGEVRKVDFFSSATGSKMKERIDSLHASIEDLSGDARKDKKTGTLSHRRIDDFQGKIWVTRKRPFIDRMAAAWLIRKFIDRAADFGFIDEKAMPSFRKGTVTFDVSGGEFTHVGDLCTFEVLVKSFGLKDKAVRKISGIVHELDVKDDKYNNVEAAGLEEILSGLRKAVKDDRELLEKGMAVFEMLYAAKTA